jgi:hypothetical protein
MGFRNLCSKMAKKVPESSSPEGGQACSAALEMNQWSSVGEKLRLVVGYVEVVCIYEVNLNVRNEAGVPGVRYMCHSGFFFKLMNKSV